jgi:RNA polymerase sigma-70 factor, ECF subfamily
MNAALAAAAVPVSPINPVDPIDHVSQLDPVPPAGIGPPRPVARSEPAGPDTRDADQAAAGPEGGAAESDAVARPAAALLESLVAAAVGGDAVARERLLGEIHPLVLRYCRGRLGRQESVIGSADDVAQDVCLAVVNALPGYTLRGLSFRAFVYGIAAHKITDTFRAIGRNRAEPMADLPDRPVVRDGPEHRLLATELTERLGSLLHRLTPRQREVLVLRIAVGMSAEETAVAVGSTPGAVRVTQHRALNRLRGIVTAPGGDDDIDGGDLDLDRG